MQLEVRYWLDPAHPRRADALECINRRFNRNLVEEANGIIVIGSEVYPPQDARRREEIYAYMSERLAADMQRYFHCQGGITAVVQPDPTPQPHAA